MRRPGKPVPTYLSHNTQKYLPKEFFLFWASFRHYFPKSGVLVAKLLSLNEPICLDCILWLWGWGSVDHLFPLAAGHSISRETGREREGDFYSYLLPRPVRITPAVVPYLGEKVTYTSSRHSSLFLHPPLQNQPQEALRETSIIWA